MLFRSGKDRRFFIIGTPLFVHAGFVLGESLPEVDFDVETDVVAVDEGLDELLVVFWQRGWHGCFLVGGGGRWAGECAFLVGDFHYG